MFALAMLLQVVAPPAASATDGAARDVVELFMDKCVKAGGGPAAAQELDRQPWRARRMTPAELGVTAPGGAATEGWIVKGEHDGWAALWRAPSQRTCAVTVRAADPKAVEALLAADVPVFFGSMGMVTSRRPDAAETVGGVPSRRIGWLVSAGSHELAIIASLADRPTDGRQELMTFTMLH